MTIDIEIGPYSASALFFFLRPLSHCLALGGSMFVIFCFKNCLRVHVVRTSRAKSSLFSVSPSPPLQDGPKMAPRSPKMAPRPPPPRWPQYDDDDDDGDDDDDDDDG